MTFPFPFLMPSVRGPAVLISRTAGTNIGNADLRLANAFDGIANQGINSCAFKNNISNNSMYVGKTLAAPTAIDRIVAYGANNDGFVTNANPACTISIYGKNGATPSNGTDGTLLGSVSFTDTSNESAGRAIASSDKDTKWAHVWANLTQTTNNNLDFAELEIWGWQ